MTDTVKLIYVRATFVDCPHCGHDNHGWLGDPRGTTNPCDECGQEFTVDPDAELRHE